LSDSDSFASVRAIIPSKDAGRVSESNVAPHTIFDPQGTWEYWFQDGRKLPNLFKTQAMYLKQN
jgi:hypothetical protein